MKVEYLKTGIGTYTHIAHIADVHIRLVKRHDEYKSVFEKFYNEIDSLPSSTLIAVLGDLFHGKSDLSPECVKLASDFLRNLADRRTTILIAGNHDATLNNKSRLDSISPLIDNIAHPNLYYLKESGLYIAGDILFNNYSIFDDYTKYIPSHQIPKIYRHQTKNLIALYHGPVQGAMTDVGYRVSSKTVSNESFDGHDIVLLGDIHRFQQLQEHSINYNKPVIVYPGSMIQQNHGEDLENHGYILWDLKNREYEFRELKNDYGFFTIEIEKGKLLSDISKMPKKVMLRARCNQTIPSEVKSLMAGLSSKHELLEITYDKIRTEEEKKNIIDTTNINLISISSNVDYQNQLIAEFLKEKKGDIITEDLLKQIFEINSLINSKLEKEIIPRNIRWKPKKFEFENMFSYGEGNVIDFTSMKGSIGLFAANASGKSSILSALSYCLFDKCDRAFKASHVLNAQKMSFNCKFQFEIEGVDYFIERFGQQDKKGNVKVDVKFYQIDREGKKIDLNGEARRNTNDVIRDYIGTYDDFLLTVLSVQNNSTGNFIDMGQAEKKDLIAKFMGITIYDELDNIAKTESREITTLLKNYSKTDYPKLLELKIQELTMSRRELEKLSIDLEKIESKFEAENERLIDEKRKIVEVESKILDVSQVLQRKNQAIEEQSKLRLKNEESSKLLEDYEKNISLIAAEIATYDEKKINQQLGEYQSTLNQLTSLNLVYERKSSELNTREKISNEKIQKAHSYDPNCKFCRETNEGHIKEMETLTFEINRLKNEIEPVSKEIKEKNLVIKSLAHVIESGKKLNSLNKNLDTFDRQKNYVTREILRNNQRLSDLEKLISAAEQEIFSYEKEKQLIESNRETNEKIRIIRENLSKLDSERRSLNRSISEINGKISGAEQQKNSYEENIKNAKIWEIQQQAYTYYMMAISRDGIPYNLISKALPRIEAEINNILHQMVEFTVELNTDGKNVSANINKNGMRWPVELGSGLEKFVLSLAIRVALINISNLPRPNFLAIDEGFGCADRENIGAMSALLSHFKGQFDFLWIVSHLDAMKDMVDTQIEIKKEKGFSKIIAG